MANLRTAPSNQVDCHRRESPPPSDGTSPPPFTGRARARARAPPRGGGHARAPPRGSTRAAAGANSLHSLSLTLARLAALAVARLAALVVDRLAALAAARLAALAVDRLAALAVARPAALAALALARLAALALSSLRSLSLGSLRSRSASHSLALAARLPTPPPAVHAAAATRARHFFQGGCHATPPTSMSYRPCRTPPSSRTNDEMLDCASSTTATVTRVVGLLALGLVVAGHVALFFATRHPGCLWAIPFSVTLSTVLFVAGLGSGVHGLIDWIMYAKKPKIAAARKTRRVAWEAKHLGRYRHRGGHP